MAAAAAAINGSAAGRPPLSSFLTTLFRAFIFTTLALRANGFLAACTGRNADGKRMIDHSASCRLSMVGDARGEYYGEAGGSYMVKEFNLLEQLEEIVRLASQPIPERPDGIVTVVKYSSVYLPECRATEAEYERMARDNPATIFLRCMKEFPDAALLIQGEANVRVFPTFDLFYGGNRVARVEGPNHIEVEELLENYQFQNSKLDLFSERAMDKRKLQWGDGKAKDMTRTPRTTARFVPGYDWNSDKGFFDAQADKFQKDFDNMFGNWVPQIDDDEGPGPSNKKNGNK